MRRCKDTTAQGFDRMKVARFMVLDIRAEPSGVRLLGLRLRARPATPIIQNWVVAL